MSPATSAADHSPARKFELVFSATQAVGTGWASATGLLKNFRAVNSSASLATLKTSEPLILRSHCSTVEVGRCLRLVGFSLRNSMAGVTPPKRYSPLLPGATESLYPALSASSTLTTPHPCEWPRNA